MKKVALGCLWLVLIFIICTILFVVFGVIETTANNNNDTDASFGLVFVIGVVLVYFTFKRLSKKKEGNQIEKTKKEKTVSYEKVEFIDCLVTGSQFDAYNGVPREVYIEDLEEWDPLDLKLEPENEYDKNAVLVLFDDKDIGYVPKQFSKKVTDYILTEHKVEAYVKKKYKKGKYLNCVIVIDIFEKR